MPWVGPNVALRASDKAWAPLPMQEGERFSAGSAGNEDIGEE